MNRRQVIAMLGAAALAPGALAQARAPIEGTLYKNPNCGCCDAHADYLRGHGFALNVVETHDLDGVKRRNRVPEPLYGCHTIEIGGYVVEGHVSASALGRLLRERPAVRGISLPGMPTGSPGMTGPKLEPFRIYSFDGTTAAPRTFAVE